MFELQMMTKILQNKVKTFSEEARCTQTLFWRFTKE